MQQYYITVEINSSFYRLPNPAYVYNWVRKAPPNFIFTAKLWQKFTHPEMYAESSGKDTVISQKDIDLFKKSIEPMAKHNKLGALLAQFPPSFKNDSSGKRLLITVFTAEMPGCGGRVIERPVINKEKHIA